MNKEIEGFKIISYNENEKILEFHLSSLKNKIFKLELYGYFGVHKLIFDKIFLKQSIIDSLKQFEKRYNYLNDFFFTIIQFTK